MFDGIKSAAGLERANLLIVLALEEQSELRGWSPGRGRRRGNAVKGSVGEDWCAVDM